MKKSFFSLLATATVTLCNNSHAALAAWQNEVLSHTNHREQASLRVFNTVSGSNPQDYTLNRAVSGATFEFIVNSGGFGRSQTLISDFQQALEFENWNDSGRYGTRKFNLNPGPDFGVAHTTNTDVHLAFVTNTSNSTTLYVNGVERATVAIGIDFNGDVTLGSDPKHTSSRSLNGVIKGFVYYSSAQDPAKIKRHADAFLAPAPEPSSIALLSFGSLSLMLRRRR